MTNKNDAIMAGWGARKPSSEDKLRLINVHLLYFVSFGFITWKMFDSLNTDGIYNQYVGVRIGFWIGFALAIIVQLAVFFAGLRVKYFKYCNISLLAFILSTFIQYGVGLHYSHSNAMKNELAASESSVNIEAMARNPRNDCINLQSDMFGYIIFLTALPLLIITNMIYPYPKDLKTTRATIMNGLAMLDFIDMAELIFADIGCYLTFETGWRVVFYLALGVSVILTAFSNGIERKDKNINPSDYIVTFLNMFFNDGLFFMLRIVTMAKTGHVYFGLIFVIKEFFSCIFRVLLLCYGNYDNDN